jgi:hypothetical protein
MKFFGGNTVGVMKNEYGSWLWAGYLWHQLANRGRYGEEENYYASETRGEASENNRHCYLVIPA